MPPGRKALDRVLEDSGQPGPQQFLAGRIYNHAGRMAQPVYSWRKASHHTVLYIIWVSLHFLVMSPIRQNYRRAIKEKMKINRFGPQLGY